MRQTLHLSLVFFLFLLLVVSSESIRALTTKQGEATEPKNTPNGGIHPETASDNTSINELMGIEACEEGDSECIERRMDSEAHLDYIYTQQHRP